MENIWITLTQITILVLEVGVGYMFTKRKILTSDALNILTVLCTRIAMPCSVVLSVSGLDNSSQFWREVSVGGILMLVIMVIQILVTARLFKTEKDNEREVYRMSCIYGNSAFMGIPIVTAVLGEEAVIYAVLMILVDTIFLFTHASLSMKGSKLTFRFLMSKIFSSVTISMILGIVICISGFQIPSIISTGLSSFSGMLTPLAMIIIGVQLAEQNIREIFKQKRYYLVAAIKLVIWPTVILMCLIPLRNIAAPIGICALVICKATPQSAVLGVLADSNGLNGKAAAGMIGLTTLVSVVTLPAIAAACRFFLFG